jgi:hypothetical protein
LWNRLSFEDSVLQSVSEQNELQGGMKMAFNYEIKKHVSTISESCKGLYATEVNIISYNGAGTKLDIRKWNKRDDKMLKGIALNREEVRKLKEALEGLEF